MNGKQLTGLIAAPFTPMDSAGEIDLDGVEPMAAALVNNGVNGAFVCGTTGECLSLTVGERMALAERWRTVAPNDFAVIVHAGHNSLPEAKALAAHASRIGATAIGAFGPSYFKPRCVEQLVAFCSEIAGAAAELPFYYYHIPPMTGIEIPICEFLQAADGKIPNLAGGKFASNDLLDYGSSLRVSGGKFNVLFGRDEFLLSGICLGARGGVGTTYNFAAPLYRDIWEAWSQKDMDKAADLQHKAAQLVAVFRQFGSLPAGKAMMAMIGLDCGPVRLPLADISAEARGALRKRLEEMGFFEYCLQA